MRVTVAPPTECVIGRSINPEHGYAQMAVGGVTKRAARYLYQRAYGPLGPELVIDHLCRNKACIRLDHLEPVTSGENTRRGVAARPRRTHCHKGHLYTGKPTAKGHSRCLVCARESHQRSVSRRRGATSEDL